jgi:hypothetical protein
VLIATLIGAAVTVGVAVWCAMRNGQPPSGMQRAILWHDPKTKLIFDFPRLSVLTGARVYVLGPIGGPTESPWMGKALLPEPPIPRQAISELTIGDREYVQVAGWPCDCVWGSMVLKDPRLNDLTPIKGRLPHGVVARGVAYVGREYSPRDNRGICGYLPIAPIWSGLAIDTLFYGTIAWGLLFLPGTLRRWRRRRGGRCVKCGYDRAGLGAESACPECGAK